MQKSLFVFGLLVLITLSRWLQWPANFSPAYALILYAGTVLRPRSLAFAVPLVAVLLSDCALGFYGDMLFVYVGYTLIVGVGLWLQPFHHNVRWGRWFMSGLLSALAFFAVSNFGVWLEGRIYTKSAAGLWECYVAALPFFERALLSTLFFSAVLLFATRAAVSTLKFSLRKKPLR